MNKPEKSKQAEIFFILTDCWVTLAFEKSSFMIHAEANAKFFQTLLPLYISYTT